jgi:hypothetical protein
MTRAFGLTGALAAALALLAAAPMLGAPWEEDETFLVGAVRGTSPWMNGPFDAYRFSSGRESDVAALVQKGAFPWYIASDFKYALFRPVTSALLGLDAWVFGDARWGYQLHAFLWLAALVLAAAVILRRAIPSREGLGALLLFALSGVHASPTGWLSARHVLIATVPMFLGLAAHVRYREQGWRPGRLLAPGLFALGLLGSESGAQSLGYVLAYELLRRDEALGARLRALLPTALVLALYAALYTSTGRGHPYGSTLADPLALITRGVPRIFVHAAVLLGGSLRPANPWGYAALRANMLVVVPLLLMAVPALRALHHASRKGATWLVLGALLALVPVMGTPLESRVLVPSSLGGAALVASVLSLGLRALRDASQRMPLRLLFVTGAGAVALVHVLLGPMELPLHYMAMRAQRQERFMAFVANGRPSDTERDVLVIGAPHFLYGQLGGYLRARHTHQPIKHWVAVADASCGHRITRTAPERIEIEPTCPGAPYGRLQTGETFRQLDWTIRVTDGFPHTRFELIFDRPIEQAPVTLVTFEGFLDKPVVLPTVGQSITLQEPAPPSLYGIDAATLWLHRHFGP